MTHPVVVVVVVVVLFTQAFSSCGDIGGISRHICALSYHLILNDQDCLGVVVQLN